MTVPCPTNDWTAGGCSRKRPLRDDMAEQRGNCKKMILGTISKVGAAG